MLQPPNSRLNTWLQYIAQRHLQDGTRNIQVLGFGAAYITGVLIITLTLSAT